MYLMWLMYIIVLIFLILMILAAVTRTHAIDLDRKHVVVTGGSSGIGLAVCIQAAKEGADVTILARNSERLSIAKKKTESQVKHSDQKISTFSIDVSQDYLKVQECVNKIEESIGPVTMLINCAGISVSKRFEDIPVTDFMKLMQVNYLGSVYMTKAVVESMKMRRMGRIVFISSQAGQLGLFGYSAYSPTKFALRGLAEALNMEMRPHNVSVTISFPPDTETPGYIEESMTMPEETKLISGTSGLFQSSDVAKKVLLDAKSGRFLSYIGLDGWMLSVLTCGMSPASSLAEILTQIVTISILRIIGLLYLANFYRMVSKCFQKSSKKSI